MTPRQRRTTPEEDFGADALSLANAHRRQQAEYGDAFTVDDEPLPQAAGPQAAGPHTPRDADDDFADLLALANNRPAPDSADEGTDAAGKAAKDVFTAESRPPTPRTMTWPEAH
ncbi:hypothetical protein G5C51_41025, partial [Streptomyces sp. A7024]|nr:hypothetical protein [Streptomyces coryli]